MAKGSLGVVLRLAAIRGGQAFVGCVLAAALGEPWQPVAIGSARDFVEDLESLLR